MGFCRRNIPRKVKRIVLVIIDSSIGSLVKLHEGNMYSFHRNGIDTVIDFKKIFLLRIYSESFISKELQFNTRLQTIISNILQMENVKHTR
jgi:hypothetical protein